MNPIPDQSIEPILDFTENPSAKMALAERYPNTSTPHQQFDASTYFDSCPFDDIFPQDFQGYENYLSGLIHGSISTAMPSPSVYPISATSSPAGAMQNFPFRTRTDPHTPEPVSAILNQSTTKQFNESFSSPDQTSADKSFASSKETDSIAGAHVQSVRNSQLEKRRAQNRNSQRAFRERKESYTNHLERELLCLQEKYDTALRCLHRLRAAYAAIESLDRFDAAFGERGMGVVLEEPKRGPESEIYGAR